MVQNNKIKNYSIIIKNIDNVIKIWNKSIKILKSKTVRIKSEIIIKDIIKIFKKT